MDRYLISSRLVELRGNVPQWKVAQDLGISQNALSMYERGERIPRDEIKIKIAQYYGQDVQSIFFAPEEHETCFI